MKGFRVEVSYPTSKSGFWWRIRYALAKMLLYALAKMLLGKGYFHESTCLTREDLEELRRQNLAYDFTKGYEKKKLRRQNEGDENG